MHELTPYITFFKFFKKYVFLLHYHVRNVSDIYLTGRLRRPFWKPPLSAAVKERQEKNMGKKKFRGRLQCPFQGAPSVPLLRGACGAPQFPKLPQGNENSEYVLSFESGFYSEWTDRQTESQNHRTIQYRIITQIYISFVSLISKKLQEL